MRELGNIGPRALFAARLASAVALALAVTASASAGDVVAIRAGTALTMDTTQGDSLGEVRDAVVLIDNGKIVAVGTRAAVAIPEGARVVDYGAAAVVLPGLVAVDSRYGSSVPSERTADLTLSAVDNFDPYTTFHGALSHGITTLYMTPARGRLVAGAAAVVKSAGPPDARVVKDSGLLHGSIAEEARRTPGFWEPRVPATVDVGLGLEQPQLPRTTMGALLALDELMRLAAGESALAAEYGPRTGAALRAALDARAVWRMGANSTAEVRALLDFFAARKLPLVLDGVGQARTLAADIARAGVPVVVRPAYRQGNDLGKSVDAVWPDDSVFAALAAAGVKVALAAPEGAPSDDLFFGAALALRGGAQLDAVLQALTRTSAEVLGVAERVGSLAPGKDADLAVFTALPLAQGGQPLATWVDGEVAWDLHRDAARLARYNAEQAGIDVDTVAPPVPATVLSVAELHLGDGHVLTPGEVLLRNGKIAEVGTRVGRPAGAVVVMGQAAMPGMIDALGFLGLEGSARPFSSRADNTRILTPGDRVDRQVAQRGITTVHLGSRNISGATTPTVAYKPAAATFEGLVVDPSAAVRMRWNEDIVVESGNVVRQTLAKAVEYRQKWDKYAADLAKWKPSAESESANEKAADNAGDKDKPAAEEAKPEEKKDAKKKKGERDPARSVTGVFEGTSKAGDASSPVRLQLMERADGTLEGNVRTVHHRDALPVTGKRDGYDVTLTAESPERSYTLKLAQVFSNDPAPDEKKGKKGQADKEKPAEKPAEEPKKDGAGMFDEPEGEKKDEGDKKDEKKEEPPVQFFLRGDILVDGVVIATLDVEQKSTAYRVVKRPELARDGGAGAPTEPKGKPKAPAIDPDLEILRRAMQGDAAVLVEVERPDQILACVAAFEEAGLKPVLIGADGAERLAEQLRGRIAGILPSRQIVRNLSATRSVNRYAELVASGLPIAFHSAAEEGAAELPTFALHAVVDGLSPQAALVALTSGAARMLGLQSRVGALSVGLDADVLLLDASPLMPGASIQRVWVNGQEIR